jgi:hypothetical protein
VAHGYGSGSEFARYFGNVSESGKSSLGTYVATWFYNSTKVGHAVKLYGQDKGINDKIMPRGIVFHKNRKTNGNTNSAGCLSVPYTVVEDWIANITGHTMVSIHSSESLMSQDISTEDASLDKVGSAPYHGEKTFENCQHSADEKWEKVVQKGVSGDDPHDSFKSQWGNLHQKVSEAENLDDWKVLNMAQNNLALIRECAAMAYITEDSPLDDERVNIDQTEKSNDGAIECQYKGAISQDFKICHKTIVEYDDILRKEEEENKKDGVNYDNKGESVIKTLGNATNSKQAQALNSQKTLVQEKEKIAKRREEFQIKKAKYLQSALSSFPTRNSLLEKCRSKYKKFNKGGIKEYKEFVKILDRKDVPVPTLPDPCYNAIEIMNVKLVQNVKARNQLKTVIKKAGLKAMDLNEKNGIFKNQGNFINRTSMTAGKSYFFNKSDNNFEQCSNNDDKCKRDKTLVKNNSFDSLTFKGGNGSKSKRNKNGILDKWTSTGVYDKKRYDHMDFVLNKPINKNLITMNNNVIEFKKYSNYRDSLGELDEYQQVSLKGYFNKIKNGKLIITDQKNVVASLNKESANNGKLKNVIYKKDGRIFEFDIEKNPAHSLFKIISHRYNQKYLELSD